MLGSRSERNKQKYGGKPPQKTRKNVKIRFSMCLDGLYATLAASRFLRLFGCNGG